MYNLIDIAEYNIYTHAFDSNNPINNSILLNQPTPSLLTIGNSEYNITMNFRGNHTKDLPKKSYQIKLKHPQKVNGAREFHLNAEYFDQSKIRNKLSLDLFKAFGVLSPDSHFVRLNINDRNEGLYLQLESVDDLYLLNRQLPSGSIYYAVNNNGNFSLNNPFTKRTKKSLLLGYERKLGMQSDDQNLIEFISIINNTTIMEFEQEIGHYLSIEQYLRWLAVAVCTQNLDGFKKNYALYRNNQTGLFEILPWDYDATFGRDWNGHEMSHDRVPIEGYNQLSYRLMFVRKFRKQYKKLIVELLNTLFTRSYLKPKISSLTQIIRPHVSNREIESIDAETEYMLQFIKNRNRFLKSEVGTLI